MSWTNNNLKYLNEVVTERVSTENNSSFTIVKFNSFSNVYITKIYNADPVKLFQSYGTSYTISIPNSIEIIGNNTFRNSNYNGVVTLPHSVTTIGDGAFFSCYANTIYLPFSLTALGTNCFQNFTHASTSYVYMWKNFKLYSQTFINKSNQSTIDTNANALLSGSTTNWTHESDLFCDIIVTQNGTKYYIDLSFNYNIFSNDNDILSGLNVYDSSNNIIGSFSDISQNSSYDYTYDNAIWNTIYNPPIGLDETLNIKFEKTKNGDVFTASNSFHINTLQQIKSVILAPENIITDLSSNLEVVLRVPTGDIAPTITIDPSYIANLDGSLTSSDGGLTWNGSINRTPGMNLLGNTLTVTTDDLSSNIVFDAYDEQYFTPEQELYNFCTYVKIEKPSSENTELTFLQLEFYDFNNNKITDGAISSSNVLNNQYVFEPKWLIDNDLSKRGTSYFAATSATYGAAKWFKYTFANPIRLKKVKIYERYSYVHNSRTYNLAVKNVNATVTIYNNSSIIHTWNSFSGSSGAVYEIVMPTYIEPKFISRQLSSQITLDPSNIEYPNTTSNFQINFTTNEKTFDDISGNVSLTSSVSNIDTSSLALTNYGFRLEGNIVADSYKDSAINKITYFETVDISGESANFTINTVPEFELLGCTLTPENLVDTDVSATLRIEFNTPITDSSPNFNFTLDPSYIATLGPMSDVSSGFVWEGTLTRTPNMNNLENKLDFNFSYNGVEVSANLVYDVVEDSSYLDSGNLIHKAKNISTISNMNYPDLSTNFVIQLTTNDVSLSVIENNITIDPSNVANIRNTSLTNYGFTLEGQIDVSGEHNVSGVKLFYEDFSSNAFDIYSVQDLVISGFVFDNAAVTYENYLSNNITLTLNRSDLTNVDISNSLSIVPTSCGQISGVSGSGNDRTITFTPTFYILESDCSLTFHFTNAQLDASMSIPFSVDTEQKIMDASLNPKGILEPNNASNFGVKFRLPVESSGIEPDVTISPSYIASAGDMTLNNDTWTGTIIKADNMNLLYNTIDFSYNGFDTSLNFNVAQNPELIVGPREIGDFVEARKLKLISTSLNDNFTVNEVKIYDDEGLILNGIGFAYESSGTNDSAHIMNNVLNDSSTASNVGVKWFKITFNNIKKIKKITIYASHSVQLELFDFNDNIITNLGQLDIDVSGTMNIAEASKQSTITRKVQSLTMTPSNIALGVNSADFEVLFSTNDVSLNTIVTNEYLTIDPSNIGTIISQSLDLNRFKLTGSFEPNTGFDTSNNKLMYTESNDISGVHVFSLDSVQLEITDVSINENINYINNTGTLNVEFTRNVSVFTTDQIIINNSGSVLDLTRIDGYKWQANVLFPHTDTNVDVNYQIDVSFNSDVSFNLTKTYNTYVPQISEITNNNSFDYIDTSGTLLLEFDKSLLHNLELTDLSYNAAKMNLSLNKLSVSSYNLIVDPIGQYAETQVITVKDYLGADSSNITLNIDTVVPSISEINLNPNMLTYAATEGILDVKFNKKLLDRDQLVLTSSSNIGYSFKQQLDENTASIVVTEVNNPPDHPLVNFTYTIEGDASENIVKSALQKWDNIITRHPIDVNNGAPEGTTKIHITFSVSEMDAGTLGYAYVDYVYYDDLNHNGQIDYSDNIYTSSGFIALSQASYNSMISETRTDGNTTLYYVLMHEIGHIIGIGPYFGHNNSPRVAYEENGVTKYYYTGVNALAKYRMYMDDINLVGIPIEDDGGAGTVNVHPEEHRIEGQTRHIGGHPHEGLDEELMTGWTESGNTIMPLSAVSIGFLQDMGYEVDYSYADEYRGINVNSNGDKILGSSLNSGANMKSTSGVYSTYTVVQYDVSVNYGIKNEEDISFNYRGTYDVSNINIDVNTIIPDVSSIEIENVLYTDVSGIVTITFNDHDGYYFHGKDASMNIYLDSSVAVFSSIGMNPIPSDSKIWTGVITTISGEFYPDAVLYLQHSGMDGLINVDVSANYRLDTDIRGLYITLPEMVPRDFGTSQSINYLTYDHKTNKLETDVSFQFNIYVEGENHDIRQFPYTDICDNFISITSNNLNPGDVVLDKGIGFTRRFWNGILTISGEVEGTFDICYNEILNPLRDDEVIEIREDKLTVNVNTILPNISNVIVPDKLTYLDISGDVEIEFDKDILPGDENNIQIEYYLADTNEYQFLNKYGDNTVSEDSSKYIFNGYSYDANKKIALGIGTYTLNVPSDHPIDLSGNYSNISIIGTTGLVTITVTGDFGTASYKCLSHGPMGGENRFIYKDVEVSSLSGSATHWKYTLSLPQEIDTSLNVTIKYRDETSGPYIRPIYGIVPDVTSVTLSETVLTYNDPSCVVTVEFNNALQGRENIYDLISLEPSSELFIQSASFSSTDDRVWIGILDISNNERNEFAYTDAKVSVNGIQSAAFGQGISGESVFNIDTILPDISNVTISKMGYSNKTSNFTIIFTKDDLDGVDISKSLSVPSNFTIANVGLINGNTLTGNIQQTGGSGLETDVSFIIDYSFNYRNDTLTKQIYRATDFEVDTRERGIKTLSLTNDTDITNNGNSYLFTYLDNIGNLTLDFFTNDLSGIDVSSDMSFNPTINYTLSNSVINDTSLNAIMTVDMSQNVGPLTFTYSDSEDRTSFQNNIFIDTRPRYITDITFSRTELTYLDKEGTLTITFNHNIFEDVDVITDLLNYPSSDLSLNNATITGSIWYCNLLSISELDGSFDVSLVYNGQTHSLPTPIILDTTIPRIDTSDETDIANKNITYFNKSTLLKITFTNDIETSGNDVITNSLKVQDLSDNVYNFEGNMDASNIVWNGILTINEYDVSLLDTTIYSTYQGGTIVNHENLKIDINTRRPILKSSNITIIDKDKFTYLEPSGTLSITFEGESVLDTSIDNFITSGSAITIGSMSRTGDTWTGNISINRHGISENQVVNVTDYYGQNASISIPVMTILPRINTLNNIVSYYTYLELGTSREIEFIFSGEVLETNIDTFANNSISINNNDCSLNSFSRLTDNSIKANFVVNQETEIDDLKINFDYYSEYYDVSVNQEFVLMNVDTRIPNIIEPTDISNTNLTYDASSTQLDVYFDASLLDTSASSILDASLVTSFLDSSIHISSFTELSKTHYRANITTEYNIDKSEGNSVTVNYMDTSATLTFNVDTILRPYSNICFPRGEKVLTDNGYKNIEQIDIKKDTIRGEKIEELTQTQTKEKKLVLIKCGALMENMPNKDTLITNNHKVLYKGNLIEAYKLVTLVESSVELVDYNGETLYNILLEGEKEGKMVVNGMIAETLSHTNNIARLYKKIRKYGETEYKKNRMIELFNQQKKK